jgi:hypothetical protein
MLDISIFPDRIGHWVWEVSDEDGVYLRSERSFMQEHEARADLENATYLVRFSLTHN